MPREFSRKVRVAEAVRRALAPLLTDLVREHGTGMVSVTAVDVSPDLKRARIHVSLYGCDDNAAVVRLLNDNAARLRHGLSRQVHLKSLPMLDFRLDDSLDRGDRMGRLLDGLKDGRDE